MQASIAHLLVAFSSGLGIGLFFFGGLWLTVRAIPRVKHPALLSLASFFTRSTVSLVVFYVVMGSHLERLLTALSGFFLMRFLLVRLLRPARNDINSGA